MSRFAISLFKNDLEHIANGYEIKITFNIFKLFIKKKKNSTVKDFWEQMKSF